LCKNKEYGVADIVWVHGDCLRLTNPALVAAPDAPAIFVWDDAVLRQRRISLKRLVFMYEALLELPVTMYRGDVVTHVRSFAQQHQATRIVTSASVAPRFRKIVAMLQQTHRVDVLPEPDFVQVPATSDLRRFTRYWRVADPQLEEMAARGAP
jgi:hypothetical protein